MTTACAEVTIRNELGLHARPAGVFSEVASRFESDVRVERTDNAEDGDGKTLMGLLKLALTCGTEIRIHATGDDAQETIDALVAVVEANFELT